MENRITMPASLSQVAPNEEVSASRNAPGYAGDLENSISMPEQHVVDRGDQTPVAGAKTEITFV